MSIVIISLLIVLFVFDLIVSLMNYAMRKQPLPESVKGIYDQKDYTKWLSYSMEKLRMDLISKSVSLILMVALLSLGFFGFLDSFSASVTSDPIGQTLIFLGLFMGFQLILGLPFEMVDTFMIEAKYGFNKTSVKTFWVDQLKGLLLGALLMGVLISVIQLLYQVFHDQLFLFFIVAWLFIALVMIVFFVLNTRVFVRLFNKLKPIEDVELKDKINALAKQCHFEVKAIFVMDASKRSSKLNGFFSGLGKTGEIVLYDTLINKLSHEQILSVLAHELGHATHKDTLKMLVVQITMLGLYALGLGFILQTPSLYTAFGLSGVHFGFAFILFTILIEPISLLLGIPVNALLRKAEYKADAFAVKMTNKEDMTEVLKILTTENFSNLNPHPFYVLLHYSHPPVAQRLSAILSDSK
jgi:STE24 endopeptidase